MAFGHIPKHMTSVGIGLENTPGTFVDPDAAYALPFTRAKIGDEPEMDEHKGPGAGMDTKAQYMTGRDTPIEYDGEVDIDAIGFVFANAYGGYSWATGKHTWIGPTWEPTDPVTTHTNRRQPWTLWENPKNFGKASTLNRKAGGVYGSRLEIAGQHRKALTFKVSGFGFKWETDTSASITNVVPTQVPIFHGKGFWTLKIGSGTLHTVVPKEFTAILDEALEGDRDTLQDANMFDISTVLPGERKHSIAMKIPLRGPYGEDLVTYLAGPRTDDIELVGTWTVGSKILKITLAAGKIEGDPFDEATKSKDPYYFNLTVTAEGAPIKIELTNEVAENGYYYQAA